MAKRRTSVELSRRDLLLAGASMATSLPLAPRALAREAYQPAGDPDWTILERQVGGRLKMPDWPLGRCLAGTEDCAAFFASAVVSRKWWKFEGGVISR